MEATLSKSYAAALAAVRSNPERRSAAQRHRIVVMRGASVVGDRSLRTHPVWDSFTVVGRHSRCGIVLTDPTADLRHLFLRSIGLRGGGVALRVLDLRTEAGFTLADGSTQTAVFAEGPVVLGVGRHVLVALPREGRSDPLPSALPEPSVRSLTGSARARLAAVERAMSPYRVNARYNRSSVIRLMPALVVAGDPRLIAASGEEHVITLCRDSLESRLVVSSDELRGGVIIGRSRQCRSEALRRITDNGTSRVHVLLVREERHVIAYDLASTSGMFHNGVSVGRVLLAPGVTLTLGSGSRALRMTWEG